MNFLEALGTITLGVILLIIWWSAESSGRVRFRGRLGALPYVVILVGIYYLGVSIWTGVTSLFTSPSPTPIPTHALTRVFTSTPDIQFSIQQTSQASKCINWRQVSSTMIGEVKCVYGSVYKTRLVGESTFQILFSNDVQTFFLAGGTYNYIVNSGDCVLAEGKVLKSSTGVPYIDIDEALYKCESWMK